MAGDRSPSKPGNPLLLVLGVALLLLVAVLVLAFTTLEIAQGGEAAVIDGLSRIPEVLEAHATTGPGDLHCRVVARTNEHLQDVINGILGVNGIMRTTTQIALTEQLGHRVLPLVAQLAT